jgi:YD repeat-containing protein
MVTLFRGKAIAFTKPGATWVLSPGEQYPYALVEAGDGFVFVDPSTNLMYTFNAAGGLTRIEDRNGNAHVVTQSSAGVSQVEDGLGRILKFTYAGAPSRLTKVEDQTGRAVSFTYAADGLASATAADGKQTTYSYTAAGVGPHLMAAETLPQGNHPYVQEYDGQGRVTRQIDSRNNATNIAYSAVLPQTASVTDPIGGVTQHFYELPGSLTRAVDANGAQSSYEYDNSNRRTAIIDRRNGHTATTYDPASGLPHRSPTRPAARPTTPTTRSRREVSPTTTLPRSTIPIRRRRNSSTTRAGTSLPSSTARAQSRPSPTTAADRC